MRIMIKGGLVYDGTGMPPRQADVLVEDGRIAAIGQQLQATDAQEVDADSKVVTPGFVDIHRHCDIAALSDPDFGTLELAQGITSTVVGNCGLAPVPTAPPSRAAVYDFLEPITGPVPEGMAFASYGEYAQALAGTPLPINIGFLAGLGAVRMAVLGFGSKPYTAQTLSGAQMHLEEAMAAGALGASTGLMYQPECYSTPEEMVAQLAPVAKAGGLLTSHIRGEGDSLVTSVQEVIDVAARAGLPLNISHFKATGKHNWRGLIFEAIECIEKARAKGQPITVDFYPYEGGATTLQSLLPPCILGEDNTASMQALATNEGKQRVRDAIYKIHPGWDNMVLGIGWARVLISSVTRPENRFMQGHTMAALAERMGIAEPADLMCDLLAAEDGKVGIVVLSMDPQDVEAVARLPYAAVISDALYGGGANPHPRLYGAFPKALRWFVREGGIWTMEEAIHRMTGMPAARVGLVDRGVLAPGMRADMCIFDPAAFADQATYTDARRLAVGMDTVLVAGQVAWRQNDRTSARAGQVLRPGVAK